MNSYRGTIADRFVVYDLLYRDRPFRACVVSRDSASESESPSKPVKTSLQARVRPQDQHWVSTLKLMNLLFFDRHEIGTDLPFPQPLLFAHVRAIKCTSKEKWSPPSEMFRKCVAHLQAELCALEPTIVIAQGYSRRCDEGCTTCSVVRAMESVCGDPGRDVYADLISLPPEERRLIARFWRTPWGSCVLLGTYPPSARGHYNRKGTGARDAELIPAVRSLKQRGFVIE